MINALEKRTFDGRKLNDVAIQRAFYEGVERGINDIVEEFHEHPAITSERYANGLIRFLESNGKMGIFHIFVGLRLIKVILKEAKKHDKYKHLIQNSVKPLMELSKAEPAGARHSDFSKEPREPSLPSRHLMKSRELENGSET